MKHIVSLSPELEKIYANASNFLGITVDEFLEEVLKEYVENLCLEEEKALIN